MSQFIVLKDEELHIKMVVGSPMYFPKATILDPLLLRGLSFCQSVVSGIHALSHPIEAYFTTMATPIQDAWALQAVSTLCRLIGVGLDPFYCLTRGPPKGFDLFSNCNMTLSLTYNSLLLIMIQSYSVPRTLEGGNL